MLYCNEKRIVTISGQFRNCSEDFKEYMNKTGEYTVEIYATPLDSSAVSQSDTVRSEKLNYKVPERKLLAPANIRLDGNNLYWDAVENASSYSVEVYINGHIMYGTHSYQQQCKMKSVIDRYGNGTYTFKVMAMADDITQYGNSAYASSSEYVVGGTPEYTEGQEEQVRNFVKRLYQVILNREAEEDGLNAWTKQLLAGKATGAQIVVGFVESDEFTQRGLTNEEVVEIMYQAMLGRTSDEDGKAGWSKILNNGCSYLNIVNGFSGSAEFNEICGSYGIIAGTVELNRQRDKNPQLTAFVARCYTQALDRQYETDGLESWCDAIITGRNTPKQVAQNFIFSEEFTQKNLDNEEYVKVLYRTFMGREADEGGLAAWVKVLESGRENRAKVLEGFSDSVEFDGILQSFGLSAGENSGNNSNNNSDITTTVQKPASITILCDGTVVTEDDDALSFYAELESLLDIKLQFVRPAHSGYKDYVGTLFGAGSQHLPDVVLLSADQYATYASLGYLWDMTDAWNNSEVKNSGRISQMGLDLFEGSKVVGPDGKYHLYGFSAIQGNGCVTYVKQSWLDAADIRELPKTYAEYYDMLTRMKEAKGADYVISAPGFWGGEMPYTNYLPEFYQDACPEFYEKNGVWVDGFTEEAMKEALQRLAGAYADGLIDPETVNRSTSKCRDLFYEDKFGVFTYWAGKWCNTLTVQMASKNMYAGATSEVLVPMPPIAEVGSYLNRIAPQWCITTDCKNPEGVFEYYLQKMLDGRDVQLLWEYGTHYTYENGEFQFTKLESSGNTASFNHIDGLLKLGEYASDFNGGVDIGIDVASPKIAQEAQAVFNANSKMAPGIKKTDKYNEYAATIWKIRKAIIADVVMGRMTVEEGMAKYNRECGDMVKEVLESLN